MDAKQESLIFYPSTKKSVFLLLIAIMFVIVCAFLISAGNVVLGGFGLVFFGLGIPVSIVQMLPNSSYLLLNQQGFTVRTMFRSHQTLWTDVTKFYIDDIGGSKMIMIDYSNTYKNNTAAQIAKNLSGHEGAISNAYKKSPDELVTILTEWKQKYAPPTPTQQL